MLFKFFGYKCRIAKFLVGTDTDVSNGSALLFLVCGQTLLHCDKIGRGIDVGLGMNAVRSVLVTGVVSGGTIAR